MNNQKQQENLANLLWQQSVVFKKHSIRIGIASIILLLLGMIILLIGLYVPFKINPIVSTSWSKANSIYATAPSYVPKEGIALQAVAIIGSFLFYAVIILLGFLAWTLTTHFMKKSQALSLKPSLAKMTPGRLLKQQMQAQLQNVMNQQQNTSANINPSHAVSDDIESLKAEISKLKQDLENKKHEK